MKIGKFTHFAGCRIVSVCLDIVGYTGDEILGKDRMSLERDLMSTHHFIHRTTSCIPSRHMLGGQQKTSCAPPLRAHFQGSQAALGTRSAETAHGLCLAWCQQGGMTQIYTRTATFSLVACPCSLRETKCNLSDEGDIALTSVSLAGSY